MTAPAGDGEDLDRGLRPAVTLVSAWVSEVARQRRIDTALLATRNDLVAFLRGDSDARLATGWRGEFLGEGIRKLVAGQAALTFDGRGGLSLIEVTPPERPEPEAVAPEAVAPEPEPEPGEL